MGSRGSNSVKVDGFQNEGDSMSKKKRQIAMQPGQAIELDPSVGVESIGSEFRAIADEFTPEAYQSVADRLQGLVENGTGFTFQKQQPKQNWIDPRVDPQPILPQGPTQTYREFAEAVVEKMAESLGVPSPLLDYESPSFSSAKIDMQPKPDPVPREDEARPCSLCESRRPAGKSYSRVYCTKAQVRYCKCYYCGHTWSQERK